MRCVDYLPREAGAIVGMCYYEGVVLLACEHGIWEVTKDLDGYYQTRRVLG